MFCIGNLTQNTNRIKINCRIKIDQKINKIKPIHKNTSAFKTDINHLQYHTEYKIIKISNQNDLHKARDFTDVINHPCYKLMRK